MKRRLLIIDKSEANKSGEKRYHSTYAPQSTFRSVARRFEEARIQIRAPSREFVDSRWREEAEKLLLLAPADNDGFMRHLFYLEKRFHEACKLAERLGRCEGPVTQSSLERQADRMEKLLEFRRNAGDEPEKIARIEQRLAYLQALTSDEVYAEFTKLTTREYEMDKLTEAQTKVVKALIDNQGSLAGEAIKELKLDARAIKSLLKEGICENPREGVLRLVEGKVTKGPPPEEKLELVKTEKPKKEPKAPKAPKEPKPPKPEKPAVNPLELCWCGCEAKVSKTSRFAPGHDAKLHSLVLKLVKVKEKKLDEKATRDAVKEVLEKTAARLNSGKVADLQREYLKSAPWMTPEILKSLSL